MRLSELGRFRPMPRGWFTMVKHVGLFALSIAGFAIAGHGWLIGSEFATVGGRVIFGALCVIQCCLFIADFWSARDDAWIMRYIRRNVIGYETWCWFERRDNQVVVEVRSRRSRVRCVDAAIPPRAQIIAFSLGGWRRSAVRIFLNYGTEDVKTVTQQLQGLVSATLWDVALINAGAPGISPEFVVSDVKGDRNTFDLADLLLFLRWYFKDAVERPVLLGAIMASLASLVDDLSSRTVEMVEEDGVQTAGEQPGAASLPTEADGKSDGGA